MDGWCAELAVRLAQYAFRWLEDQRPRGANDRRREKRLAVTEPSQLSVRRRTGENDSITKDSRRKCNRAARRGWRFARKSLPSPNRRSKSRRAVRRRKRQE